VALGSTQLEKEMSTRNVTWGVRAGAYGLHPYHFHVSIVLKSGTLKACPGLYRDCFYRIIRKNTKYEIRKKNLGILETHARAHTHTHTDTHNVPCM